MTSSLSSHGIVTESSWIVHSLARTPAQARIGSGSDQGSERNGSCIGNRALHAFGEAVSIHGVEIATEGETENA